MKAVVMAGGEGSRLRPLTVGRPKPMVPIVNKPAMSHILDLLKSHGITEVIVTLRYMASWIQDFFGDGSALGMQIDYVVEETPLGTAGSVKNAARYLDDTFLVVSGDAVTDFDLTKIIQAHLDRRALATLTLYRVSDPLEYGVIVTDEQGRVTQFQEKPSWSDVQSDTVNTGIYVLDPAVLVMVPDGVSYDFSKDLFPHMLKEKMSLYGYVADGYWCDVGNLEEYTRANADMVSGRVKLPEPMGTHIGNDVWVGRDVEIAPDAVLKGPIYLGNEVKIKRGVSIYGPSVIRDYTVIDNFTRIERTVIWRNTYVGESCELRGAIIGRQCSIKSKVAVYEGAVVGDRSVLEEGCVLYPTVRLWPQKKVAPGASVRESIIWGSQGRRVLFTRYGVSGLVNVDLTPEFAAKLGSALGAILNWNSYVAINRDAHRSSRMLKRALISGLAGSGINVMDLGMVAIPVARYFVRRSPTIDAGVHVRLSPFDQRVVDMRFMDANGMNQSKELERKVEASFFREDFRRAFMDELGVIDYAQGPIESYVKDFLGQVNREQIREANFKIVVDYAYGLAADSLASILTRLNIDVVPLSARVDEARLSVLRDDFRATLRQMAAIVQAVGANLGVLFDVGGEKIFLVDEKGHVLDDVMAGAAMLELALHAHPDRPVAYPIHMPSLLDVIAGWHNASVTHTKGELHHLMQAADRPDMLLALDGSGNFIFPFFHPSVDGMMATVKLLEYLANRKLPLSEVVAYLPRAYMASARVPCGWDAKGTVMRLLNDRYRDTDIRTIDGIKILRAKQEWVHIMPNPDNPYFEITVESNSEEAAHQLVKEYVIELLDLVDETEQNLG